MSFSRRPSLSLCKETGNHERADDEHFQEASLGGSFLRGSAALFLLVDGGMKLIKPS
jgi:hypothetical protein